jgi:hypothetical protein
MLASLTPCLRHKSATETPASCSFKAYRLGYRSQRETPRDRSLSRAFALRANIGGEGGFGDYILKPKGMHKRTFERGLEKVRRAECIVDMHGELLLDRLKALDRKSKGHSARRGSGLHKRREGGAP